MKVHFLPERAANVLRKSVFAAVPAFDCIVYVVTVELVTALHFLSFATQRIGSGLLGFV